MSDHSIIHKTSKIRREMAQFRDIDNQYKIGRTIMKKLVTFLAVCLFFAPSAFAVDLLEIIKTGTPAEVQAAIDDGADFTTRDEDGRTLLMDAVIVARYPGNIEILLLAGAKVDARDRLGCTALYWAAAVVKDPMIIDILINAGADVNAKDFEGMTPLMEAAYLGRYPEIIMALLKAGADGKLKSNKGKTAFDYASNNRFLKGTDAYWELSDSRY